MKSHGPERAGTPGAPDALDAPVGAAVTPGPARSGRGTPRSTPPQQNATQEPRMSRTATANRGVAEVIRCAVVGDFAGWLSNAGGSIGLTTYQAGKVVLIGWDGRQVT